MMKSLPYILLWLLISPILMLSSCSNDTTVATDENLPILFTGKSSASNASSYTLIASGIKVGIFINENATSPIYAYTQNCEYVSDGAGGLSPSSGEIPHYPADGNSVNIFGYAPYSSSYSLLSGTYAFNVKQDQTETADYLASDLLWGHPVNPVAKQTTAVSYAFSHMLSNITFTLTAANNLTSTELTGAKVILCNQLPATTLKLSDGTVGTATGTAEEITMGTINAVNDAVSCIIVPQTIAAGSVFLKVKLTDGRTFTYTLGTMGETFASGYTYAFNASINKEITMTTSITDWTTSGSTTTGNADSGK